MTNKITLRDFLFLIRGRITYLKTDNETFPKEFRSSHIFYASLYMELYKKDKSGEVWNRNIKSIRMTSVNRSIELDREGNETNVAIDMDTGYYTKNSETGELVPFCTAIEIELETPEYAKGE